jgi:hypothetical protein
VTALRVEIDGEYRDPDGSIRLMAGGTELVMWDSQERIEDPSLVFVIAEAIRVGYEHGPARVRPS